MDRTQVALCVQMIFPLNGKGRGGIEEGASEALSELVGVFGEQLLMALEKSASLLLAISVYDHRWKSTGQ